MGWSRCRWGVIDEERESEGSAQVGPYRLREGVWNVLGEQWGATEEIATRLCDKVIVTFYFCIVKKESCFFCFFHFWPHCAACGILVPLPGIEPGPTAVKAESSES